MREKRSLNPPKHTKWSLDRKLQGVVYVDIQLVIPTKGTHTKCWQRKHTTLYANC